MELEKQKQSFESTLNARSILQKELVRRCQKNPKYSLRAFAKSLGLSHALLSLVLSGKRSLSNKLRQKMIQTLELNQSEIQNVLNINSNEISNQNYKQLSLDSFALISDWYHFAILSLLDLPQQIKDAKQISMYLGISEMEAKDALQRLERLELIRKSNSGKWKSTGTPIKIDNTDSTSATRKFHRQLLEKAIRCLEEEPMKNRDFSTTTLAIDIEQIPYAREKIKKFRHELAKDLESKGKANSVCQLMIQIFSISKMETKNDLKLKSKNEKENL